MITLIQQRDLGEALSRARVGTDNAMHALGECEAGPLNDAVADLARSVQELHRVVRDLVLSQEIR